MHIKFDNKEIGKILYSSNVVKLCNSEGEKLAGKIRKSRHTVSVKKTRYGVAVYKTSKGQKKFLETKKEMLNAISKK